MAEALKILQELLCVLGKSMSAELPQVMGAVWRLFEAAPAAFEALVLPRSEEEEDGGQAGEAEARLGGEIVTFESVVEQLYEFLLTVLGASSLQEQLKNALQVMAFNTITFMQVRPALPAACVRGTCGHSAAQISECGSHCARSCMHKNVCTHCSPLAVLERWLLAAGPHLPCGTCIMGCTPPRVCMCTGRRCVSMDTVAAAHETALGSG